MFNKTYSNLNSMLKLKINGTVDKLSWRELQYNFPYSFDSEKKCCISVTPFLEFWCVFTVTTCITFPSASSCNLRYTHLSWCILTVAKCIALFLVSHTVATFITPFLERTPFLVHHKYCNMHYTVPGVLYCCNISLHLSSGVLTVATCITPFLVLHNSCDMCTFSWCVITVATFVPSYLGVITVAICLTFLIVPHNFVQHA